MNTCNALTFIATAAVDQSKAAHMHVEQYKVCSHASLYMNCMHVVYSVSIESVV